MVSAADVGYLALAEISALAWLALAAVVYVAGRKRPVNIALATFLGVSGLNALVLEVPDLVADAAIRHNLLLAIDATALATIPAYVGFVASAVDSPLTRPLRSRGARIAILALVVVAPAQYLVRVAQGDPSPFAPLEAPFFEMALILVAGWSTLAAYDAYRRAPEGSLAQRRTRSYFLAFVTNDVAQVLAAMGVILIAYMGQETVGRALISGVAASLSLVFLGLLARALLRDQLFDFDLKLKRGIRRGTVASAYVGAFVAATSISQYYLSARYGVVVGAAATGLIHVAKKRVDRVADRVASKAVPDAEPSSDYLAFKKLDVYRAQVEVVLADDGVIDAKERALLDRLRRSLALRPEDAAAIERDVAANGEPATTG